MTTATTDKRGRQLENRHGRPNQTVEEEPQQSEAYTSKEAKKSAKKTKEAEAQREAPERITGRGVISKAVLAQRSRQQTFYQQAEEYCKEMWGSAVCEHSGAEKGHRSAEAAVYVSMAG
jgi:hypothetical protein